MKPWDSWISEATKAMGASAVQTLKNRAAMGDMHSKMDLEDLERQKRDREQKSLREAAGMEMGSYTPVTAKALRRARASGYA